jgi:flagellar hook-associated protein 2
LNISLKKTGSTDFKVSADHKSLMNQIKDWVQRLNDITEYIRAKSSYDTKSARSGPLTGDSLARELEARLRSSVTSAIVLGDKIGSLADIGISMGKYGTQDAGKLIINTDTLTEKLNQDVGYVMSIFGADELGAASNNGVAKSLLSLAEMYLKNGSGLVSRHTQMIDLTIGNLARQVQDMEARMAKREAELYRKYTRMEVELTRLQNQSAMIGIQMDKLV